jgi:hypothetical protein
MKSGYQHIQWVVQQNLTNQSDFDQIKNACQKIGVPFLGLNIIPFTKKLPAFERSSHSIIYGSTTFNALAFGDERLSKGVFYDELHFSMENYIEKWQQHMLNYDAQVITFKTLMEDGQYKDDQLLFIRPNDDGKSFAGEVKQLNEISDWYEKLKAVENTNLSLDSKIVVSTPYNIQYEWRLWIINKKVIAASKYREYFQLKKEAGCPIDVVAFAEARCREYTPHDVFVMDICLCGDSYFIVECNCMNGAGFYKANVEAIVVGVTDYFANQL